MSTLQNLFSLAGRVLFAPLYIGAGVNKIMHWSDTAAKMEAQDMPMVGSVTLPGAIAILVLGGLSVLLGFKARIGAIALIVFLVLATLVFHDFWNVEDVQAAVTEQIQFMKNLGLIGGMCFLLAFGSGKWSLDERRKKV
jgi:uncharacterized membrane protein YphA (DoxX/SURF4 family)